MGKVFLSTALSALLMALSVIAAPQHKAAPLKSASRPQQAVKLRADYAPAASAAKVETGKARPVRAEVSKRPTSRQRRQPSRRKVDPGRLAAGVGCGGTIISAEPASGTEDARQPHDIAPGSDSDPALRQGIGSVAEPIVITASDAGLSADCFVFCETAPDPLLGDNGIATVVEDPPGTYTITLDFAIAPNQWTTIALDGCGDGPECFVEYLSMPGNVDADNITGSLDILKIIDFINGIEEPPFGIYSSDIDRTGVANPGDILRVIDLLNGADAYAPQLGFEKPDNTCPIIDVASNDECPGARILGCGDTDTIFITEEGYTSNDNDPTSTCELDVGGPFSHDASWWYRFTAPAEISSVTLSMCETDPLEDAVMTIFTADSTCVNLEEQGCDDDSCVPPGSFGPPSLTAAVQPGESYIVLVDRYEAAEFSDGPYIISVECSAGDELGACCIADGCTDNVTQVQCVNGGGEFQGADTLCADVECGVSVANDECLGALPVSCGDSDTVDASNYTSGANDPTSSCELGNGGPFTHDASWWYEFTAPAGVAQLTVSMCETADNEDAVMTIFNANSTCNALGEQACNDDACVPPPNFGPPETTTEVVEGETYLILVDRYQGGDSTDGPYITNFICSTGGAEGACCVAENCIDDITQSACQDLGGLYQGETTVCDQIECPISGNDNCADAVPITDGETEFSTENATTDGPPLPAECDEGFGVILGQDIWFDYTATCTGVATFSTCNDADFDTRLALYNTCGVCPPIELVGCNDDGPNCADFTSELTVDVVEGECYTFRLGGFGTNSGSGIVTVSCAAPPDGCVDATGDCCAENDSPGCDDPTCCALVCERDPFCCLVDWDPNCVGLANDNCASCAPPGACCVDGACSDDATPTACADLGGSFQGSGSTCDNVTCPDIANDECIGATPMTCGSTQTIFISDGYTSNPSDPTSTCELDGGGPFAHDASWWYEFTAPAGVNEVTVSMCQTADNEDTVMTMFTPGTCAASEELACDDDSCAMGFTPSEFTAPVEPGQSYIVLVDRYSGGESTDGPYTIEFNCP